MRFTNLPPGAQEAIRIATAKMRWAQESTERRRRGQDPDPEPYTDEDTALEVLQDVFGNPRGLGWANGARPALYDAIRLCQRRVWESSTGRTSYAAARHLAEQRTEKACNACGRVKPLDAFYRKPTLDGRGSRCRACKRRRTA